MSAVGSVFERVEADTLASAVGKAVGAGGRLVDLFALPAEHGATELVVLVAEGGEAGASSPPGIRAYAARLEPGRDEYRSVTTEVPAAFWYERAVHDLFGLVPVGHPRLDPLVFPLRGQASGRMRPGRPDAPAEITPNLVALPGHVEGEGVFTIPYGPVRSGVFESVEYLVETFGEDIPRVRVRPYLKHRGVGRRFSGLSIDDGVLLAERVEGAMSVAHACAFSQAVEAMAGVEVPRGASYQRMVHAELERIANHLDSMNRHTEGAGQAVAHARLTWAKERIMRLQAALCGHRFGRGVVRPGGTSGPPLIDPSAARSELESIRSDAATDLRLLMTTPSFLDRLRRTGLIPTADAIAHGAVGPVGRGSGAGADTRIERPYGAYRELRPRPAEVRTVGDTLERQWVRVEEIAGSFNLAGLALDALDRIAGEAGAAAWSVPVPVEDGLGLAAVESPQGELVYLVQAAGGKLENVRVRTASFHNFALFSSSFRGDIFTDFVFIEASFSVSQAGVAG